MRQKLDARIAEVAKVRAEKIKVERDLDVARLTLASSSIPEVSELQRAKLDLQFAEADLVKANKRYASLQNDMNFARDNYQKASSAAAEMRGEVEELKAEKIKLERKASDNRVEIQRIQAASDKEAYLQLISELEIEKAGIERELINKTEELARMQNGRRSTRGSSVPRSPRTATMSPAQSSRPLVRAIGMGSRGNSPAPGTESTFRGPNTFGGDLFAGSVPSRFGKHLE